MPIKQTDYTHYGLLFGIVPVYVDMTDPHCPAIDERHWSLVPLNELCHALFGAYTWLATAISAEYEPGFPLTITGEIH